MSAPSSAGAVLRRAREARGLHIAALAATLKVPQSKLEALEADRYQDLPDATFARALARSVCRVMKLDAAQVLILLPSSGAEASLDRVTPGLNQPFRARSVSQDPALSTALLKRPAVLGVGVLLIAAVAVYAIPSSWIEQVTQRFRQSESSATAPGPGNVFGTSPTTTDTPPTTVETPVANVSDPTPQTSVGAAPQTAPTTTQAVPTQQATTASPVPSGNATTVTTTAATPATTAPTQPAPVAPPGQAVQAGVPAPGTSPLKVRASAESWVEVVDAKGQVLLSRLLRSGDLVDVNGVPPLKLRVGNVSGTELVFRGQTVDLAARSRDNVARLELN
ncbi:helix-turn-helix domain-containing protein [Roseateles chitinivorans]|uniref:helix-turn-helix domain-containing protein n=1 Tax=Roseateles chitinivorans TaxID=2917965 RepID=UPI003D67AE3F